MSIDTKALREMDELVEAARLLGATQAKKLFGCYTDEDRRFERAMYESIDKHRAALCELLAKVERLREIVRPKREDECLTLDHWRMRAYYLEENCPRCSRACAIEQDKREQAEARAERLAEALRDATASMQTIADKAGRDEYLMTMDQVRGYANSRANAAHAALGQEKSQ